ncbi:MAG: alanine racemase [Nannocystaceae bacterium]|nr:alanine racemase [Nannocystaceae bacterium]
MPTSSQASARVQAILRALAPRLDTLLTPALVLELDAITHNVRAMADFAGPGRWRPHVKTHKHPEVVRALLAEDVKAFKCATLDELDMTLQTAGPTAVDVLLAYPLHPAGAAAAARLATRFPQSQVRLLADSPEHLRQLDTALGSAPTRLTALLDVDVGMRRTGTAAELWAGASPSADNLDLVGLHGYEGHLTWSQAEDATRGYAQLAQLAQAVAFDVRWVVTSGTHAFHHALRNTTLRDAPWQHQVSPGTLVLSDLRTAPAAELLSLQQAAFVLSRVIATPGPGRVTLDAGTKGLNPDCPAPGCAAVDQPTLHASTASEEHRPCRVEKGSLMLGDIVALIPEHVCTTVNLYRQAQLVRGERDLGSASVTAGSRSHDARAFEGADPP